MGTNIAESPSKVGQIIFDSSADFVGTLTQYKWDLLPESQLQAAEQALTKSDYISKIALQNPAAVHTALVNAAVLGLDLTEGKRQGWLLPRENQKKQTVITLQVGYKGVEAIHQGMGVIDRLVIRVVRKNDTLDWSGDDQEKPTHTANHMNSDEIRGEITGAYAITYYPDKSINVIVIGINEIHTKHRDISSSWKAYIVKKNNNEYAYPTPWTTHEKAMVEKTMAFISAKQWPANIRDGERSSKILETLHEVDVADYKSIYSIEQKMAFDNFIKSNDSLGLFLFTKRVGIEIHAALYGTFKKGEKIKMKELCNEMVKLGSDQLVLVEQGLDAKDDFQVKENIDDCLDITIKLLKYSLNTMQNSYLDELLKT